jgi:putative ABC transport system permease protein
MRTPLAWHNLTYNKLRTAVAVAGVGFAVLLIFMQLGFLGAVERTAQLMYDALDFDLVVRSPKYLHISEPRGFSEQRLYQVAAMPGVRSVVPLHIGLNRWQVPANPGSATPGSRRGVLSLGIDPGRQPFRSPEIREKSQLLTDRQFVLVDRRSRPEFGPANGRQFSDEDIGVVTGLNGKQVKVVGHYALGTGLAADGDLLMSVEGFRRLWPFRDPDEVSLGLVHLEPGADAPGAAARLQDGLPDDVEVLTRAEAVRRELTRWVWETSIGVIFVLGVAVSLVVGTAIVYQVLSSDVMNHLPEYATLKAMGYSNRYLSGVVLSQALGLAILGFVPGLGLSLALYWVTSHGANIPIEMTAGRTLGVLLMTAGMCAVSGLGALRKVWSADPASLF